MARSGPPFAVEHSSEKVATDAQERLHTMAQIITAHRSVEELMEACRAEPAKANGDRLQLYREIAGQLVTQLDDEKPLSRAAFFVNDPDGAIKLGFLKRLAFEQMALDVVTDDSEDLEDETRALTDEIILEKAKRFVAQENLTNIPPHHLAADVKATPLLRQVGANDYAFANPTIQEYLAAAALADHSDYEKIFCRAFFNPTLVETEVLPMALGLVKDPNALYTTLTQLPESLNYANLRLRARGLRYASRVNEQHLTGLIDRLASIATERDEATPYSDSIIRSFSGAIGKFLDRAVEAFLNGNPLAVAPAIAKIGGDKALEVLLKNLQSEGEFLRMAVADALGTLGDMRAIDGLIAALGDESDVIRWRAAEALGKIGGEKAVAGLFEALNNDESEEVRRRAALALGKLGYRQVLDECLEALNDSNELVSGRAAEALGEIGTEQVIPELLATLVGNNYLTTEKAVSALRKIKGEALANGLVKALSHEDSSVRRRAAEVIIYYTDSDQALKELSRVTAADPVSEIRTEARKAQEQFYRRLYYFRKEPSLLLAEQIGREAALEETRAFIAHEVKSAIGPLRIVAQLLNEAVQSPGLDRDKLSEYTERILKQTEAAYEVVNQYVDYTKPLRLKRELTDINQLIEHSLAEVRADCGQRSINIIRRFEPAAHASVDRSLMSQVLRNVLHNAIEAMEGGGALTITTRLEENQIVIQVSDTGAGFKPDDVSRVFELGFTTKLGKRGAGIGLALARRIIGEGHDGSISVANNTEGKGATVIIKLPVTKEIKPDGKQSLAPARR